MFGAYRKTEKQNIDLFFHFSFARLNGIIECSDDTQATCHFYIILCI